MFAVFERIGYKITLEEVPDWDVLWSHGYPFTEFTVFKNKLLNLKPHQRVSSMLSDRSDFRTRGEVFDLAMPLTQAFHKKWNK